METVTNLSTVIEEGGDLMAIELLVVSFPYTFWSFSSFLSFFFSGCFCKFKVKIKLW